MVTEPRDLEKLLAGTILSNRKIYRFNVLNSGHYAFVTKIEPSEVQIAWEEARNLFPDTKLWPVAYILWGAGSDDWQSSLNEEDFFSRFYFKEEDQKRYMPAHVLESSSKIDPADLIKRRLSELSGSEYLEDSLSASLHETERKCGAVPPHDYLEKLKSKLDLEERLLLWEEDNNAQVDVGYLRREWFTQDPTVMLFMPVSNCWDILAYVHWYGATQTSSADVIAMGRSWEQEFGAELVAHYGTMLGCFVRNPPANLSAAFELAKEHFAIAPYEFYATNLSLRDYARGLVGSYSWFLHERP